MERNLINFFKNYQKIEQKRNEILLNALGTCGIFAVIFLSSSSFSFSHFLPNFVDS